jgi:purine-binding chemotaxis protein CheW
MADFSGVRLLVFRVAGLVCAAEAATVRETLSVLPATRVPGAPEQVSGVVNVRGDLVTLVDGRRALGQSAGPTDSGSIVLLDVGSRAVGFVVDEVIDLIAVSAGELADRQELPGIDPAVVRAVGRRAELSFVLLDFDALLRPIFPS